MIGLVSSEWLRIRSRRLVKVLAAVALAGIVIALVIGAAQSRRPSADELESARLSAEAARDDCIAQGGFGAVEPGGDVEAFCRQEMNSAVFLGKPPMRLSELPETLRGTAFIAILVGLVIGASAVGASWQTGTITTILTWEPRRLRVAVVRAVVVATAVFMLVVALLGVLILLFWVTTSLRGLTSISEGWPSEVAGVVLRVSMLSAAASVIGGAIAMLGRNTAAALGAVFVYLAVLEGLVRGLRPALGRFLLGDNIATAVIGHEVTFGATTLTPGRAWVVVSIYTLGLAALAAAVFRVRDVH